MAATLERQIYEAIRGKCVSDASAERAAALAAELAVEKFTSTNTARDAITALYEEALAIIKVYHNCDEAWDIYREHSPEMKRLRAKFDSAVTAPVA